MQAGRRTGKAVQCRREIKNALPLKALLLTLLLIIFQSRSLIRHWLPPESSHPLLRASKGHRVPPDPKLQPSTPELETDTQSILLWISVFGTSASHDALLISPGYRT